MGRVTGDSGFEIYRGELRRWGAAIPIPKGLLFVLLARAGWRGQDGPLSHEFMVRFRQIDPRLSHFYLRAA